jgi:hypothetical protein
MTQSKSTIGRRVIYEDGPLWVGLTTKVDTLIEVTAEDRKLIRATRRAIVGGIDELTGTRIEGLGEKVDRVGEKVDEVRAQTSNTVESVREKNEQEVAAITKDVQEARRIVERADKKFGLLTIGVWTGVISLIVLLLNTEAGWFGSARVILHPH